MVSADQPQSLDITPATAHCHSFAGWKCLPAGQPQRSAAARSRLLGYHTRQPPLLTDGRCERRQPLEERLKVRVSVPLDSGLAL